MKENCKFNSITGGPSNLVTLSKRYSLAQGMGKGKHDFNWFSVLDNG